MDSKARQTGCNVQSDPDGDVVDNIIVGGRLFGIVESVIKGGIFDNLEKEGNPISVTSFCDKHAYRADVMERILNLLVYAGLVVKTEINGVWKYTNSQCVSKYLTKASPCDRSVALFAEKHYVADMLSKLHVFVRNDSLTNHVPELFTDPDRCSAITSDVKIGIQNNNARERLNMNEIKKSVTEIPTMKKEMSELSPENFMKTMDSMIYSVQHIIPRAFDLSGHRKAVDLGGGSGLMAKLFVDHYPRMSIQVFELPHIANMVRTQYQHQTNYCQRLTFVAGDFFKDELPSADLYILSHVLHSWGEPEINQLLQKVFESLPSGGELLILEKFLSEDKNGPPLVLTMDLMIAVISRGRERTQFEYTQLLDNHGFVNTRMRVVGGANNYDAILTSKPF